MACLSGSFGRWVVLVSLSVLAAACGDTATSAPGDADVDDVQTGRDITPGVDTDAVDDAIPPDSDSVPDARPARVVELLIEPADTTVVTELGVAATVNYQATALYDDGTRIVPATGVQWATVPGSPALIDVVTGIATVNGESPRDSTILASYGGAAAQAILRTRIQQREVAEDVDPTWFDGVPGGPDGAPRILYPLDGTMYPAGILPPVVQWDTAGHAAFRVEVRQDDLVRLEVFTRSNQWQPSRQQWRVLTSTSGYPTQITVAGVPEGGGAVLVSAPTTLQTADADLAGAVYYWQIATGDIMRIPQGATEPEPVFTTNANTGTCRGCHALTRDGGRLGFMYNGGDNPRAGLAWVYAPEPAIIENNSALQWDWLSFDPSGNRAAAVYFGDMFLADTTPGVEGGAANLGMVEAANALGDVTHPSWSPDGSRVTFVHRDDGVDWSFDSGRMYQMTWDQATQTFGVPALLVPQGETPETDTISYPSWSPDSRWLAYSVGPDNRGTAPAHLHMADPLSGANWRLERAAPNGEDVLPSFSPYREGGYYWLLFYSNRPYGHITDQKQLWVAAIDSDIVPGVDASYPAFWLPGQDPTQVNITGYWGPPACTLRGNECKGVNDCCAGLECRPDAALGITTCQESACTLPGTPCIDSSVCCPGAECRPNLDGVAVCQLLLE